VSSTVCSHPLDDENSPNFKENLCSTVIPTRRVSFQWKPCCTTRFYLTFSYICPLMSHPLILSSRIFIFMRSHELHDAGAYQLYVHTAQLSKLIHPRPPPCCLLCFLSLVPNDSDRTAMLCHYIQLGMTLALPCQNQYQQILDGNASNSVGPETHIPPQRLGLRVQCCPPTS